MYRIGLFHIILCIIIACAGCTQLGPSAVPPAPALPGESGQGWNTTLPQHNLTIFFISVGQGDSILQESPEEKTMLVDAGPTSASEYLVGFLKQENITSLDIALATHAHEDHIGGMLAVLDAFPVKEFVWNGYPGTTTYYDRLMKTIAAKMIPLSSVSTGDTIVLDPSLSIAVLNPPQPDFDDQNNNSIVLRVAYRNVSFLLAGDAAQGSEAAIPAGNATLISDILKVGHHGDSRSISARFLTAVHPNIGIIEAGYENDHTNPSPKVLVRLAAQNVTVYGPI